MASGNVDALGSVDGVGSASVGGDCVASVVLGMTMGCGDVCVAATTVGVEGVKVSDPLQASSGSKSKRMSRLISDYLS